MQEKPETTSIPKQAPSCASAYMETPIKPRIKAWQMVAIVPLFCLRWFQDEVTAWLSRNRKS